VAVDGADGDAGAIGDRGDGRGDVAALGDQLERGGDDPLVDLGLACLGSLGGPIGD
jgi:hypothetical protein